MNGSKGVKMRASMHVPELEGASPSLRVRNPFREQKKGKKNFEKFTPNMAFIYSLPYIESTVKAQKEHFSSNNERVKRHENEGNPHVPGGEAAKSSFGRVGNPT